uniref:Uncharacterized protein n=1 Tax=Arundo donax TaxID=35708 RepID=A0A0A9CLM8_ARUDO
MLTSDFSILLPHRLALPAQATLGPMRHRRRRHVPGAPASNPPNIMRENDSKCASFPYRHRPPLLPQNRRHSPLPLGARPPAHHPPRQYSSPISICGSNVTLRAICILQLRHHLPSRNEIRLPNPRLPIFLGPPMTPTSPGHRGIWYPS